MSARRAGFFPALFDFSFSEFVTARLLKVIYAGGIAVWSIIGLVAFVGSLGSAPRALIALVVVPLGVLVAIILTRIWLEMLIVVFRIADHAGETAEQAAAIAINTARTSVHA